MTAKIDSLPFLDGKLKGKRYIMPWWGNNTENILIQLVNVSDRAFSGWKLIRHSFNTNITVFMHFRLCKFLRLN